MVGDNYMWIPDKSGQVVTGETNDEWFASRGAFEVSNFKFNLTAEEATEGVKGPSGSSAGKAKFGSFTIDKVVDTATQPLYKGCCLGTIFPTIMLGVRRTGGSHLLYLQYIFRYNQVTGITWEGASGQERPKAGLRLITLDGVLKGSEDGKVVVPGDSKKSLLVIAASRIDDETAMPPKRKPGRGGPGGPGGPPPRDGGGPGGPGGRGGFGPPPKPLTAEQVGVLRAWVDQGAK